MWPGFGWLPEPSGSTTSSRVSPSPPPLQCYSASASQCISATVPYLARISTLVKRTLQQPSPQPQQKSYPRKPPQHPVSSFQSPILQDCSLLPNQLVNRSSEPRQTFRRASHSTKEPNRIGKSRVDARLRDQSAAEAAISGLDTPISRANQTSHGPPVFCVGNLSSCSTNRTKNRDPRTCATRTPRCNGPCHSGEGERQRGGTLACTFR